MLGSDILWGVLFSLLDFLVFSSPSNSSYPSQAGLWTSYVNIDLKPSFSFYHGTYDDDGDDGDDVDVNDS